jgi:caffeoyl-CoA O-methyltransferase
MNSTIFEEFSMLTLVPDAIEHYARAHTCSETSLMLSLKEATYAETNLPQMLSGPLVGQTLRSLTRLSGGTLAVEVGTFTGYASLWIAGGLKAHGRLITMDIDASCTAIAQRYWDQDPLGERIELRLGAAAETLASLDQAIDFAFIDADKVGYIDYYEMIMERLKPGGVIVADNVLWSGRVLQPTEDSDHALCAYAKHVAADPRSEQVMLTVRDGLLVSVKI